ncbi:methyltransferase domain protein [bacterium BMS3Bbin11]|nr:methyltransferase domain protein [bacterium BMS3Abin11]GBE46195.1 methyltransferase domain protein [bacterium BMS3Bbin11]HDH16562.1 methyltransferase domain-containing protein [Gammaproteobacteria bacterium]HDZ79467.1 methyltransferase domain-containing protein [Gammaproteobacteria bacterium]
MKYTFFEPEKVIKTPEFKYILTFLSATGRTQIGWHYAIDLAWIYSQIRNWPTGYKILDAGGGRGPTQFLLAELGFNVTNLDLALSEPAASIQKRYRIQFKTADSKRDAAYGDHLSKNYAKQNVLRKLRRAVSGSRFYQYATTNHYHRVHERWRVDNGIVNEVGKLVWMRANLCKIPEISSNSFDAVVSLSALEHIPIELLPQAWAEITRICKPEAKFAITTSATEQQATWYHKPSQGNCFSEDDLKRLFGAYPDETNLPANGMIGKYQACTYLKDNLADFYRKSAENGMPHGKWEPRYFPVGLVH